jgi:prepilin-type N-terminal cleavage/methylation domain-containing protein
MGAAGEAGFTLLEMLVTLVVLMVVSLIVGRCITLGLDACADTHDRVRMQEVGQAVIQELTSGLRDARYVQMDADKRGFLLQTLDSATYYRFDVQSGKLKRDSVEPQGRMPTSNLNPRGVEVTECVFTDIGDSVRIDLSLRPTRHSDDAFAEYRVAAYVPIPNRSWAPRPRSNPDHGADSALPAGIRWSDPRGTARR